LFLRYSNHGSFWKVHVLLKAAGQTHLPALMTSDLQYLPLFLPLCDIIIHLPLTSRQNQQARICLLYLPLFELLYQNMSQMISPRQLRRNSLGLTVNAYLRSTMTQSSSVLCHQYEIFMIKKIQTAHRCQSKKIRKSAVFEIRAVKRLIQFNSTLFAKYKKIQRI